MCVPLWERACSRIGMSVDISIAWVDAFAGKPRFNKFCHKKTGLSRFFIAAKRYQNEAFARPSR